MAGFYRAFAAAQAARLAAAFRPRPGPRIDDNLPYGLRIGGSVLFEDEVPFIIAAGTGHLVEKPKGGIARIAAYGRMPAEGNTIHRCYLEADAGDEESFLQAIGGPDGQPIAGELRLFRLFREIMPATPEEWSVWLPANPDDPNERYLVGYRQLDVPDAADASRVQASYARLWPQGGPEQVAPILLEERLNADPFGSDTAVVMHRVMLYGRALSPPHSMPPGTPLPDELVWLQVSEYPDRAMVQLYAGLTLEPGDVRIVPPGA
jgi:Protein of unknown function (DUF2491)